jgi:hypothetical protein
VIGVNVGGRVKLELKKTKGSMSILIPGQDDLLRRYCDGVRGQQLKIWFLLGSEVHAWEFVKTTLAGDKPKEIFFVIGQTMTTEYAIDHIQDKTSVCNIEVEANHEIPVTFKLNNLVGTNYQHASFVGGRLDMKKRLGEDGSPLYHSVFLDVSRKSPRLFSFLNKNKAVKKLIKFFQYFHTSRIIQLIVIGTSRSGTGFKWKRAGFRTSVILASATAAAQILSLARYTYFFRFH